MIEHIGTGSGTKTSLNSGLSTIESFVGDYLIFLRGQKGYISLKKSNGSLKKIARIRANDIISDFSNNSAKLDEAILKVYEDAGIEYDNYHCNEPVIYKASVSYSLGNPRVICEQTAYRIAVAVYESSGHWRGICSSNYMLGISIIKNIGTIYMCILSGTNPF